MYLFLAIVLSLAASAQVTSPECDPLELERQCEAQICQATTVPRMSDLIRDLPANALIDPSTERSLKPLRRQIRERSQILRGQLNTATPETIWNSILNAENPKKYLETFFSGNVGLIMDHPFLNDLSTDVEIYRPLLEVFQALDQLSSALNHSHYLSNSGSVLNGRMRDTVLFMLDWMNISTNDPARKSAVRELRTRLANGGVGRPSDKNLFSSEAIRNELFRTYLQTKKNVITSAINSQLREHRSHDWESDFRRREQTCRLKGHLIPQVRAASNPQALRNMATSVITSFNERLLPRFSSHTRAIIAPRLRPSIFSLLKPEYTDKFDSIDVQGEGTIVSNLMILQTNTIKECQLETIFSAQRIGSYYDGDNQQIFISPLHLIYGGPGVLYHELGHHVSSLMVTGASPESKRKLLELRSCLTSMHGSFTSNSPKHEGDQNNTEEDFADWVAAITYQGPRNYGCEMLRINPLEEVRTSAYTSRRNDVHSNTLFRELHMRMIRSEELPGPCRQLIDHSAEAPKKCEL